MITTKIPARLCCAAFFHATSLFVIASCISYPVVVVFLHFFHPSNEPSVHPPSTKQPTTTTQPQNENETNTRTTPSQHTQTRNLRAFEKKFRSQRNSRKKLNSVKHRFELNGSCK